MIGEWQRFRLDQVAEIIGGGTPSTRVDAYFGGNIPWITPKDLSGYPFRHIRAGERSLTQAGLQASSARMLPKGSVLFTSRAPVGYVAIADCEVATNQGLRSLVPRPGFCSEFLYYLLKANKDEIEHHASGSTFREIAGSVLGGLQFRFPPLPEQRAIAHILGTLDDKIALNRRMSATLEEMARALFKAWFVDFEPVRARMAGRPSASAPGELGELFPARLVPSELGEIPEGWRVGTVADLGRVVTGKTPPTAKAECFGGDVPFVRIPDMHGQVFVVRTTLTLTSAGSSLQSKQLIPENSVCVSCIATPGVVAITSRPSHTNQQINSVVCRSSISPYWVYFLMEALKDEILTRASGGSATLNLNKGEFCKIDVLLPTNRVLRSYDSLVKDTFLSILSLALESETLGALRDALLPRLVSGEMRVGEAEEWMREATEPIKGAGHDHDRPDSV